MAKNCLAAIGLAALCFSSVAVAQAVPQVVPQMSNTVASAVETREWRFIKLKNIAPRIMAWWLDPAHHAEPSEFSNGRTLLQMNGVRPHNTPAAPDNVLPAGVEKIIDIEPRNELLVFGTKGGTETLEKTVASLDKPLRQVEIEWQVVQMRAADIVAFRTQFTSSDNVKPGNNAKPPLTIGYARKNFRALLGAFESKNRLKRIVAPRVTAVSGQTSAIGTSLATPTVIAAQDETGKFQPLALAPQDAKTPTFHLTSTQIFAATPTINADQTVTVQLTLAKTQSLGTDAAPANTLLLKPLGEVSTLVNLKDGDAIMLQNIPPEVLRAEKLSVDADSRLVAFLIVHIVANPLN